METKMTVLHVLLWVLVCVSVKHSHGRTCDCETITTDGNTNTSDVKAPSYTLGSYDYFSLVLQWPKSFCNTNGVTCTGLIPPYFTVHGLWPQLCSGDCNCCNGAYTLNYATDYCNSATNSDYDKRVCDFMINNWPNLKPPRDNNRFWDYEYNKHGSCFIPFQNPWFYFQMTFDMATRIGNVTDSLSLAGINPGDTKLLSEFENAIFLYLKVYPRVRLNNIDSGIWQLSEIEFCFNYYTAADRSYLILIDCRSNSICGTWQPQGNPPVWVRFPQP